MAFSSDVEPVRVAKTRQDKNPGFDLVIFDCDGVLVDSEVISCRAHAETLTRHGYPITAEQVLKRFLGVSDREARLTIEDEMGRNLPEDFEALMKQGVMVDWREPNVIRVAAVPLYNSFEDIWRFGEIVDKLMG